MKINKYIAILAITLFFTSCEKDDEVAVANQTSNIQIIVEPFSATPIPNLIGQVGTNSLSIDLGFRLTEYTTTYNDSDINIIYSGNVYTIPAGDREVMVGLTMVDFELNPSGDVPYNGFSSTSLISFDDLYDIEVVDRPSSLVVIKGAPIAISSTIYAGVPVASTDSVELVFLNEDAQANIWFGMSQFTAGGSWITDYNQNSGSTYPRRMSIPLDGNGNINTIPNSTDVSPNVLGLDLYPQTGISNPMGYTILIRFPDDTLQILNGFIPAGTFVDNAIAKVEVTDDVANPGMKNYVFSAF